MDIPDLKLVGRPIHLPKDEAFRPPNRTQPSGSLGGPSLGPNSPSGAKWLTNTRASTFAANPGLSPRLKEHLDHTTGSEHKI